MKFIATNVSEVKLSYVTKVPTTDRPKVASSSDSVNILFPIFQETIEHVESFYILLLNRGNRVLGVKQVGLGGVAGCVADPKVIFQTAILANASGIILCHNHPSGNLQPSQADKDITQRIKQAGRLLEIQVLDHIILTPDRDIYYSFADIGAI